TLVVAGQRGWLSDETLARLLLTPELRDAVRFVEGPTDAELAWLYRNCAFTVYPARYEGWGLPVSESLDFGKLCLSSDTSSLPEAGHGLTDLLDPVDRAAWHDRIVHYWDAPDVVAARERAIAADHVRVTAGDTALAVLAMAGLARKEPACRSASRWCSRTSSSRRAAAATGCTTGWPSTWPTEGTGS